MELDEFKFIIRNLCNKIDRSLDVHENLVFDYLMENVELSECISKNRVVMASFKKALLNLTLNYKYFIILIVKNFS